MKIRHIYRNHTLKVEEIHQILWVFNDFSSCIIFPSVNIWGTSELRILMFYLSYKYVVHWKNTITLFIVAGDQQGGVTCILNTHECVPKTIEWSKD